MPAGEKLHFFISHASENADYAKWLDGLLRAAGHNTTTQGYDFRPGRSFLDLMQDALAKSDHVLTLCSAAFFKKDFPLKELYSALAKDGLNRRRKLIPIRIEEIEIPDLLADFIFVDLFNKPEDQATEAILNAIKPEIERTPVAYPGPKSTRYRTSISKLPAVDPTLIGRDNELAKLDAAWADPAANCIQIIAPGGTGKTALMTHWYRHHVGEATIFGWSFYSQGVSDKSQTSSDPFFADILPFFGVKIEPTASIYTKAEAIARRLREERVLLILDGIEPLQDHTGELKDKPLLALLQELSVQNKGLVVCTTRVRLSDIPDDDPRALSIDLDNLLPEDGARYLAHLGVTGTEEELREASVKFGNHALALTLLGTYIVDFCDRDIRRSVEIRELMIDDTKPGRHARRVMEAYAHMFKGRIELDVLRALGYFDRPAEPDALRVILPSIDDRKYRAALNSLRRARLILSADPREPLDCHPLIREHFAWVMRTTSPDAFREGHSHLYEYYCKKAPHRPNTLEEMTPLFYAVYHGCKADRHQEAFIDVFHDRIRRGKEAFLIYKLGWFGTNLSLLANFFESPWTQPVTPLSDAYRAWVINSAAFALQALGRLSDALDPMKLGGERDATHNDWKNAAIAYTNLSELHQTLGNISEAIETARQTVTFADRSGDAFWKIPTLATLAAALHQSGNLAEAGRLFHEAERLEAELTPQFAILSSLRGYQYCDLLLDQGQIAEALRRATQTIKWFTRPLIIGLDHITLGRAQAPGDHLNQAVQYLRQAGQLDFLPLALLARGTDHDLEEVYRIATRSGMRLHLADYHLAMARRHLDPAHLAQAEALINETGYHRRDRALAELKQLLAISSKPNPA